MVVADTELAVDTNLSNYADAYEEWDEIDEIECPACYGTGLDRDEIYDCSYCFGEGYVAA